MSTIAISDKILYNLSEVKQLMINFSDVRRGTEPTFLFFARHLRTPLEYALQECQITGWQIMSLREVRPYLPEGYVIPEVRLYPGAPRVEKHVLAFVSYYNQSDMARKLEQLQNDPDIISWQNNRADRVYRACLRDDRWVKDPPPFYPFAAPAAEEDSAQIPGVRRSDEPAFFFFPQQYAPDLAHYLENHDVTGWQIMQDTEAIRPLLPRTPADGEAVLISCFDPEDMRRKLDEILSSEEITTWRQHNAAHTAAWQAYKRKQYDDPPPFPEKIQEERPDRH